jgi:hypothetical protein
MTHVDVSLTPQPGWQDVVGELAEQAHATFPTTNGRLDKAVQIVLSGHVALLPDGTATVTSQQPGDPTQYHVTPRTCECRDFPTAPDGRCKHVLALLLATKATTVLAQRQSTANGTAPVASMLPPSAPQAVAGAHTARSVPSEQQVIAEVMAQAERGCQAAIEATPSAYRGFLLFLPRNKKVGGTKAHPLYVPIREPYMTVDGRVKMACDEHRTQGATLGIQTTFAVEPHTGQLVCCATVTSALLGSVTAHARVFVGGSGVDESNPLENAETSAVGRALGFLGYGVYGTGMASAEEVLYAQAMRQGTTADLSAPALPAAGPSRIGGKPPTAKQQGLLKDLLREAGVPEEEIVLRLSQVTTSREASIRIDQLRSQLRQRSA